MIKKAEKIRNTKILLNAIGGAGKIGACKSAPQTKIV